MNVKPGDMAIIVGSKTNAGLIVEVLHAEQLHTNPSAPAWMVKADRPFFVSGTFNGVPICEYKDTTAVCPDSWLRPVSGLPMTDDVDTEVPA